MFVKNQIPPKEHHAYLSWLNTPGLVIPAGKSSVEYYLETKEQRSVMDYV